MKQPDHLEHDPDDARAALAGTRIASGLLHLEDAEAGLDAAGHLLHKAAARLEEGDETSARHFVERALHLPYDEHEDIQPALSWLQLEMSNRLSEEVELSADGDTGWLDRARTLLSEVSGPAAAVVSGALHDARSQFTLSADEQRRLAALIDGAEFDTEPLSHVRGESVTDAAMAVLRALNRQAELFAATLR